MPEGKSEWQPIETAPRNWTGIILYDPVCDPEVFQGYYSEPDGGDDCWMEDQGMGSEQVFPTHWMPLPSPPSSTEER